MFGSTKCGKCEGTLFKVETIEPMGSASKLIAVQCQKCGTPIGITTYYNPGTMLKNQKEEIEALGNRLSSIESTLRQIAAALQRRG